MTAVSRNNKPPRTMNAAGRTASAGTRARDTQPRTAIWRRRCLGPLAMLAGLTGCSPYQLAHQTLHSELAEYPRVTDGRLACQQYQQWAKREWQLLCEEESGENQSSDYASGFIQGFTDQVYAGGEAQAPPMPPRKYWRIGYRNDDGQAAIQDWYHGFAHGARVAKEKGYRDRAVIPSSMYLTETELAAQSEKMSQLEPTPADRSPNETVPTPAESIDTLPPAPAATESQELPEVPAPGPLEMPIPTDSASRPQPLPNAATRASAATTPGQPAASDLPAETAHDVPPAPPWHTSPAGSAGDVRPAAAAEPLEFDPFAGTSFHSASITPTPSPLVSAAVGSTAPATHPDADRTPRPAVATTPIPARGITSAGPAGVVASDGQWASHPLSPAANVPTAPSAGLPTMLIRSGSVPQEPLIHSSVPLREHGPAPLAPLAEPGRPLAGQQPSEQPEDDGAPTRSAAVDDPAPVPPASDGDSGWQAKAVQPTSEWKSKR